MLNAGHCILPFAQTEKSSSGMFFSTVLSFFNDSNGIQTNKNTGFLFPFTCIFHKGIKAKFSFSAKFDFSTASSDTKIE